MRSIEFKDGKVRFINVRKLPHTLEIVETTDYRRVAIAIKNMEIRGAPAIGVAAAFTLALAAYHSRCRDVECMLSELERVAALVRSTRPTAVNLFWAVSRVLSKARASAGGVEEVRRAVVGEALRMAEEDVEVNRRMSIIGASLIEDGDVILTHCNTGMLATVDIGTALGVIIRAYQEGKKIFVYATETRPALQGARLTAWELKRAGVPFKLIVDSAVGLVMARKGVTKVFVGADRILRDGHVINKIGTYQIAVLAREHGAEFYAVAPTSTIDLESRVEDVVIEERDQREVLEVMGVRIAPQGVEAYNPVFDITPPSYVSGIVTENGIARPPYEESIPKIALGKQ